MESDSISALSQQAQLLTDAILKAAAGVLLPQGAIIPDGCLVLGGNPSQARVRIREELRKVGYVPGHNEEGTFKDLSQEDRINLVVETATRVANGARRHIVDNYDPEEVAAIPAMELLRVYDRGAPEDDWPNRWSAAAIAANDFNALRVLEKTNRMVALKSSGIWQALGNGVGGNDDALGNPWPPFTFDSGYDCEGVDRAECVKLGLLNRDEETKPATIPSQIETTRRLAAKLRQRLTKLEGEEQERRNDPLTFGTCDELLELARQILDLSEKLTPERSREIKSIVEKAIERGINAHDESLIEIYEAINESQKADACRQALADREAERVRAFGEGYFLIESAENLYKSAQEFTPELFKQLFDLVEMAFEKGIGAQFNLRARAHFLLMNVYERLQEPEKAETNRLQYVENASGHMLLNDVQIQLHDLGKNIEIKAGAKILDMLTKAVERISRNYPDKHAEAYRATAEVLEAIGDFPHAVEYYEYALQKNPKIAVKRRLSVLKKKIRSSVA